jgi:hypothetical protein
MDLFSIVGKVWRHKLATIPVIMLMALGAFYVIAVKAPVYQSTSGILLVNPPGPPSAAQIARHPALGKVNTNNTFVSFGNLDVIADAVIGVVTAESNQLLRQGVDPRYTLTLSAEVGLPPMIQVTGIGRTAQVAILSTQVVTRAAMASLNQIQVQQHVNPTYMIKSVELYGPTAPTVSVSSKLRTLIAVIALGTIMLFVAVSMSESIGKRRKGHKNSDGGSDMDQYSVPRVSPRVFRRADREDHEEDPVIRRDRVSVSRLTRRSN